MQGVLQSSSPACRGGVLQFTHTAPPQRLVPRNSKLSLHIASETFLMMIFRYLIPHTEMYLSCLQITQIHSTIHMSSRSMF